MIAWAEREIAFSRPMPKSDRTYRQQLEAIRDATGETPADLANHPKNPPFFAWVWQWFVDFPPNITWSEIRSWSDVYGVKIQRWEGEILIRLDRLRLE